MLKQITTRELKRKEIRDYERAAATFTEARNQSLEESEIERFKS